MAKGAAIAIGIAAAVGLAMSSSGSAKAAPVTPTPPTPPTPPPGPKPPAIEYLPGTTTPKDRVRVIDATTTTPGAFAAKYGGNAGRWKEIAAANPTGTVFPGSPAIEVINWTQLDTDADGNTLGTGHSVQGLSPWNLGQVVKLPDGW